MVRCKIFTFYLEYSRVQCALYQISSGIGFGLANIFCFNTYSKTPGFVMCTFGPALYNHWMSVTAFNRYIRLTNATKTSKRITVLMFRIINYFFVTFHCSILCHFFNRGNDYSFNLEQFENVFLSTSLTLGNCM